MKILIISLIAGCVYGLIEGIILLISEKTLEEKIYDLKINKKYLFDHFAAGLLTGGISSFLALLLSGFISKKLKNKFPIKESIFIDAFGILFGCILITISYIIYKYFKNKKKQNKD